MKFRHRDEFGSVAVRLTATVRPAAEPRSVQDHDQDDVDSKAARISERAAGVLRSSEERDPAALTRFVQLRVIDPEGAYWLRGIEAATRWLRETGNSELRVPYTYVTQDDWGAVGSHPLGVWLADARKYYAAETLEASRVIKLENLGMVWSVHASAWDAGLEVARTYAAVHDTACPPRRPSGSRSHSAHG
ncbi:helicase associated domain-containing protein [Streptomyces sp. NPDC006285]|uniref:helicase associated domain-containing protein n=1 Tax=Streptomyces sp. NPDC006285 TaxID=3364742 RepID=UPI0036892954